MASIVSCASRSWARNSASSPVCGLASPFAAALGQLGSVTLRTGDVGMASLIRRRVLVARLQRTEFERQAYPGGVGEIPDEPA